MKLVKTIPLFLIILFFLTDCNLFKKYEHYEGKLASEIGNDLIKKIESGKYKEVESYFDYLVKKKKYSIDGTRLLEDIYLHISKKRDIADILEKWIASRRNHHSAYIMRGLYYTMHAWRERGGGLGYTVSKEGGKLFRDRLQLAQSDFELAYEIKPEDPNSASAMILVCTGLGFDERTMESWYQKGVKADPNNLTTYLYKLNYLFPKWHGSLEKATKFARYCHENSPKGSIVYTITYHYLCENAKRSKNEKIYFERKQIKKALGLIFGGWLTDYPNSTLARVNQASIQSYLGNSDKVIEYCNEALEIDPNCLPALAARGKTYVRTQKTNECKKAEKDFLKIIENDPHNDEAYFMLGNIAGEVYREYENAIKYYDMAISLNPINKIYLFRRGSTHFYFREYQSAIKDLKAAIEIDPRYQPAYQYLGHTYDALGEGGKAKEVYNKLEELHEKETLKKLAGAFALGSLDKYFSRKPVLQLNSLKSIPLKAADILSKYTGILHLNGVESITPEIAQRISRKKKGLELGGLKSITPQTAQILAQVEGHLCLGGIESINREVAAHLANHRKKKLDLSGLRSITPEVAEQLCKHEGRLCLNGLQMITPEIAKYLSEKKGWLELGSLSTIVPESSKHLSRHKGMLYLTGLKNITSEIAEHLSKHSGILNLQGLDQISPEVAYQLGKGQINLILSGLNSITPEVAKNLVVKVKALNLKGLKELSPEVAYQLAKLNGQLTLSGLRTITPEVAKHLGNHTGYLDLRGLEVITPEVAKHLSAHTGSYLDLRGLKKVPPEVTEQLKRHKGKVGLPSYR